MLIDSCYIPFSSLKNIHSFCEENDIDFRDVVSNILDNERDFEIDDYRFIHFEDIDEIQQEELRSDLYLLGCFKSSFLFHHTDLPLKVIEVLQNNELYEELGELIVDDVDNIQREYARCDGYGHHFAHYDHNTLELLNVNGSNYYVFRIN